MARPRAFDETEVIERAVDVFWAKGFADTSIGDLEEALGMGRQSLYNAFGDKRTLFLRALELYTERGRSLLRDVFDGSRRGLDAISAYFESTISFLTASDERRGCFMTRCLMDHGTVDTEVAHRCLSSEQERIDLFKRALAEAVEDGALPASLDLAAAAHLLATQVNGLSVMARSGASNASMRQSTSFLIEQLKR